MSIYEKTKCARALLYWAANNNGNEAYYLEDRMYAVADNGMVILLTADSYDEAIRKAKARQNRFLEDKMYNESVSRCEGFDSCRECNENGCGCDDPDEPENISDVADRLFNKIMGGKF